MLFAIAILLAGMVGIASVLGVAGRNAARSQTLAESQAVANNALNTFYAYEMKRISNWDPPFAVPANGGVCIDPLGHHVYRPEFGNITIDIRRAWLKTGNGVTVSPKMAEYLFSGGDEFAIQDDSDSTLPITRMFEPLRNGMFGKVSTKQNYSWFAIIKFRQRVSNRGILWIVVAKNRDFTEPDMVVTVRPLSGNNFNNETGSALRVVIEGVPSGKRLKTGDWIMVSRRRNNTWADENAFDAWYRITNISEEVVGPGGSSYTATLSGRNLPKESPTDSITYLGTMVNNVVSVHERVVTLMQ
jgi:hypothetical protein